MSETATTIPVSTVIPILTAISARNFPLFKELEKQFVMQYGVEIWEDVFNQRLKPALDRESDRWLLVQWCSQGIASVKDVG